ncbi:MAG: tetraacyldisaccharide 4'-kinase [Methylophaga sp.]|nr:MAG: tetraacyldisaccharide 4'-kinase [Methylophaga sp.]
MKWLINSWYQPHPIRWLLSPLSAFYRMIILLRKWCYHLGIFKQYHLSVPVIIVGNISLGGTGKTPFVIWLTQQLQKAGMRPGIISRGYGGHAKQYPQIVSPTSDPSIVGDEPILISRHTHCPIAVAPNRHAAGQMLLQQFDCNIIIADDGLQHYALGRDIEVAIIDGERLFGNQYCLPAGPLREPLARLEHVNFIVHNGGQSPTDFRMTLSQAVAINLIDPTLRKNISEFADQIVHAVAGIGHPQRFFEQLIQQNLHIISHPFADHYAFQITDLSFGDDKPIFMTEKDAVKCQSFANKNMWVIPIEAQITGKLDQQILQTIAGLSSHG